MPIQYRCPACDQLLSISTRKAGHEVPCPRCGEVTIVPEIAAEPAPEQDEPHGDERQETGIASSTPAAPESPAPRQAFIDEPAEEEIPAHDPERLFEDPLKLPPDLHHDHIIETAEPSTVIYAEKEDTDAGGFQVRRARPEMGDLDLTSMVDVTFLLLIFFMVTASFSLQKTIELPPPKADQKGAAQSLSIEDLQANTIFVKIDENNGIFIDDVPAGGDPTKLADAIAQAQVSTGRTDLAIDAHPEALHETVVQVIDAATAAGMQKIRIVSRPEAE